MINYYKVNKKTINNLNKLDNDKWLCLGIKILLIKKINK